MNVSKADETSPLSVDKKDCMKLRIKLFFKAESLFFFFFFFFYILHVQILIHQIFWVPQNLCENDKKNASCGWQL